MEPRYKNTTNLGTIGPKHIMARTYTHPKTHAGMQFNFEHHAWQKSLWADDFAGSCFCYLSAAQKRSTNHHKTWEIATSSQKMLSPALIMVILCWKKYEPGWSAPISTQISCHPAPGKGAASVFMASGQLHKPSGQRPKATKTEQIVYVLHIVFLFLHKSK